MPQLKAAKKSLRQNIRRRAVNDRWRKKMRQEVHAVKESLAEKNKEAALEAYTKAQSALDRAARRHVVHPNKAARKKSRLLRKINFLISPSLDGRG